MQDGDGMYYRFVTHRATRDALSCYCRVGRRGGGGGDNDDQTTVPRRLDLNLTPCD